MKYLKLYENFNEEDIHDICEEYNITNYTINGDVIDVDGDVSEKARKGFKLKTYQFKCDQEHGIISLSKNIKSLIK